MVVVILYLLAILVAMVMMDIPILTFNALGLVNLPGWIAALVLNWFFGVVFTISAFWLIEEYQEDKIERTLKEEFEKEENNG